MASMSISPILAKLGRLAIRSPSCSVESEDTFGPQVSAHCLEGFDFTLYFEETILSVPVTLILCLHSLVRIYYLRKYTTKANGGLLHVAKLVGWAFLALLQLILLGLYGSGSPAAAKTRATVGTAVLSFLASIGFGFLSHYEHTRTVRPATILNIFLALSLFLDLARARTLFFVQENDAIPVIFSVTVVLRALLLIPESTSKVPLLKEEYRRIAPETTSGVFGQSLFLWLNPLLAHGNREVLSTDDLPGLDESLSSSGTGDIGLERCWEKVSRTRTKHSLLLASLQYYLWSILAGVLPRALQVGFVFAQPFLVDTTVSWIQDAEGPNVQNEGYGLIGAFAIVYIGIAVSTAVAQHKAYRVIAMMRANLVDMIYSKTLVMMATNIEESAPVTLMSADIERISSGLRYIHDAWACVAEIPIALYLLWKQLGVASIAPIGVALVCMVGAMAISALAGSRQKLWLEAIEKRVDATAKVLGSMKGIKMTGLTDKLSRILQSMRGEEIKKSEKFRELLILVVGLAYSNVSISPVVSFAIYSVLAQRNGTEPLTPAKAFTSLTLFTLLSIPIGNVVEAAAGLATAVGSLERINQFLLSESRQDDRLTEAVISQWSISSDLEKRLRELPRISLSFISPDSSVIQFCRPNSEGSLIAHGRSAGWDDKKPAVVGDLSFEIHPATLTVIVGPVGCGKSTFINALLGETPIYKGQLRVLPSAIAYCSQNPWLTNNTVQQNILGESLFDLEWYNTVVRACALEHDILHMPQGDQSMLGSQGAVLSGGQKQRLSLARAVYSKLDTIIMDDVLSGLDPTTEEHIFNALLGEMGILRAHGTTVIMTTHSLHRLPYSDHIIVLGPTGQITEQGSFQELNSKKTGYVQSLSLQEQSTSSTDASAKASGSDSATEITLSLSNPVTDMPLPEGDRRTGDFTVYGYYIKTLGFGRSMIFLVLMAGYVFFISFPSIWVQWWSSANVTDPNGRLGYWLGVYAVFGILAVALIVISCWHLMANLVSHAASSMHFKLLRSVLNAPMSFFYTTDLGTTTNRFSQDLQLIDMELPLAMLNTLLTFLTCLAQMIIVCVSAQFIAATIPGLIVAFYFIQKYYLRTSRQLRFLDIEAKSPLFSNFLETLAGLSTLRSYKWEKHYRVRNSRLINSSQKPFYLLFCIQRWLELVIGLTVAGFAIVLVSIAVATRGKLSAGFVGVALLNVVTFSENLQGLVTQWTVLETSIGAVSRIRSFTSTVVSEHRLEEMDVPPMKWPEEGRIEFQNVVASYKAESDPVLIGISLVVGAGKKVGICGRTGSGKSSLVSTLFRLMELTSGSIVIDGLDIATIKREELRTRLICIPQEPYLLQGCSVRLNVDPSESLADGVIVDALRKVQLWEVVTELGGLDATLTLEALSQGQRQLLCFARAMVRKAGRILVLDEATSSIDPETDKIMQSLIRSEFKYHTVIAIAHRLDTILDFDEIIVIDQGRVKESGPPQTLLQTGGAFKELYMDSNIGMGRTPVP